MWYTSTKTSISDPFPSCPDRLQPKPWDQLPASSPSLLSAWTFHPEPQTPARVGALKLCLVLSALFPRSLKSCLLPSKHSPTLCSWLASVPNVAQPQSDLVMMLAQWLWTTWLPSFRAIPGMWGSSSPPSSLQLSLPSCNVLFCGLLAYLRPEFKTAHSPPWLCQRALPCPNPCECHFWQRNFPWMSLGREEWDLAPVRAGPGAGQPVPTVGPLADFTLWMRGSLVREVTY